jgi:hypothetical protein
METTSSNRLKRIPGSPKVERIEVIEEGDDRFVVSTYSDGSIIRTRVNKENKPPRRPRRPWIKLGVGRLDRTPKKRI